MKCDDSTIFTDTNDFNNAVLTVTFLADEGMDLGTDLPVQIATSD